MKIEPQFILEDLKEGKNPRTQKSLDKLNEILEEYYRSGQKDFCITTIGRISSAGGGPGYHSLRATQNGHFRRIVEAWAAKSGTNLKKPLAPLSRQRDIPADHQLLEHISDLAVRARVSLIIAERNRSLAIASSCSTSVISATGFAIAAPLRASSMVALRSFSVGMTTSAPGQLSYPDSLCECIDTGRRSLFVLEAGGR